MSEETEKRWAWYGQMRDAILFIFGMALVGYEAQSPNGADPTIVTAGMTCILAAATGVTGRWVVKRLENGKNG